MDSKLDNPQELHALIKEGALVLTMSNRQKNWCIQTYMQHLAAERGSDQLVIEEPNIYTLHEWVASQTNSLEADSLDQAWLWKNCFNDYITSHLTPEENLAEANIRLLQQAQKFERLCSEWQIVLQDRLWNYSLAEMHRKWLTAFQKSCAYHQCKTHSMMLNEITTAQQHNTPNNGKNKLVLIGLLFTNPLLEKFFNSFRNRNIQICHWSPQPAKNQNYITVRNQPEDALKWIAEKSQELWQQNKRVLVVVPDVNANWWETFICFSKVFYPQQSIHKVLLDNQRPFNLSGGVQITKVPAIALALDLIELTPGTRIHQLLPLLYNPVIGLGISWGERKQILEKLQQYHYHSHLREIAKLAGSDYQPLQTWCHNLISAIEKQPDKAYPSEWAEQFNHLLNTVNWLQHPSDDAFDFQIYQHWHECLQQLSRLDRFNTTVDLQGSCQMLRYAANNTLYQPKLENAPVQILSTFESIGMYFDHTLVLGLDEKQIYAIQQSENILPYDIQIQHNMPGSTPDAIHKDAQQLWHALTKSSPELTLCHAYMDGESVAATNPFMKEIKPEIVTPPISETQSSNNIEYIYKEHGTIQAEGALSASKLTAAMQCSWKGWWAIHNMKLDTIEPVIYPQKSHQGQILHYAMALLAQDGFNTIQQATKNEHDEQLHKIVINAIQQAYRKYKRLVPQLNGTTLNYIQQYWTQIIIKWLSKNETGTTPDKTEQKIEANIGGFTVGIRIDRIDKLSNNQVVIIDYKTGQVKSPAPKAERTNDPQLLIYAATIQQNKQQTAGLAYGLLLPLYKSNWNLSGTSQAQQYLLNNVKNNEEDDDNWNHDLEKSIAFLHNYFTQFRQGEIRLDPIDKNSCRYCTLDASCRIAAYKHFVADT